MAYNGLNLENVKNQNRSSILKLLNDQGPMSRKDISARLGLTPASVTTLCAELLAQPDIDGGLIGGASLKPVDFSKIVAATAQGACE